MEQTTGPPATSRFEPGANAASPTPGDSLDVLLSLGAAMLQAGNTAIRTREWMELLARKMGFDAIAVSFTFDSLLASIRRHDASAIAMRNVGPPSFNAGRIAELERLAKEVHRGEVPEDLSARLSKITSAPARYSNLQIGAAIAIASGGFAFVNGGGLLEVIGAGIGGGIGQCIRSLLSRRRVNHYAVAMLSAVAATTIYVLATILMAQLGLGFASHPGGFIASVLFLVPGFPLLAALFDLLQYQTLAAVGRLAYGGMMLLAVAFGMSIVIAIAGIDLSPRLPLDLAYPLKLILRGVASFGGGSAFAILFNSSPRAVLAAGILAVCANGLRLFSIDAGMMLAPAAFFAALLVGLVAVMADRWLDAPPISTVVPPIIIMVPGTQAYQMIISLNHGKMLEALQAGAACGFIVAALAVGLAAARLFSWQTLDRQSARGG